MLLMTYQLHEASCLLCWRTIEFFIAKKENDINERKRQLGTVLFLLKLSRESDFRIRHLKEEHVIFIKYTVMRFR